jgi:hypothetical protein
MSILTLVHRTGMRLIVGFVSKEIQKTSILTMNRIDV